MTRVKIVILNWNGRDYLERFLPSLVSRTPGAGIVVADNGSTDDSVRFLERSYPQVELLRLDRNYGYAEGYNRALAGLNAEYFVLLNSDVEVTEGWLDPLVRTLDGDGSVAAVSPKIRSFGEPDKFEYAGAAGGFIYFLGYPFCRGLILDSIESDKGQYDDPREVFWASGACMAVRADVFRSLGGFDLGGLCLLVSLSERSESKDLVRRFGGSRQAGTPEPPVLQHARCCQGYGFVAGRLYGF